MNKYILFELDHGGPTNIILAFKFLVYIAYITNRILIIPPSKSIYHYFRFEWDSLWRGYGGCENAKSYCIINRSK